MSCRLLRTQSCTIPDKPNNPSLAKENDTKLQNMLAERAKQDALLFANNEVKMSKDIAQKK
jgi:capsule polysaccharide export protein KpsE/RkpR